MNQYKTIYNEIYDISDLPPKEQGFLRKVKKFYETNPDWNKFANFWRKKIEEVLKRKSAKEIINSYAYRICEDLESRLGIKQGYTKPADYRDMLEELIDNQYTSRYKFCKKNGMREDLISRVLNKRRDVSINTLQKILKPLHREICFREIPTPEQIKEKEPFVTV